MTFQKTTDKNTTAMDIAQNQQPLTASNELAEDAMPSEFARTEEAPPTQTASQGSSKIKTPPGLNHSYRFIRQLGHGAQSNVFLAERRSDHEKVAIKQLRIDSIKTWKEYTLFHREAEVLATLDIPGVVKLYEARDCLDFEPPCSYIVQEYIEGPTLKQLLASGYRFSLAQIYDLVLQLTEILKKLHSHDPQVIHRDIKPSNIILKHWNDGAFEVCLLDFGAVANPQVQSGGSTIAGTFGYMSPEQLIGRATPASDTYALAALMAYLLSGVDPGEMTIKDLRLIIDPYVESQPRALVQMLRQMLEPDLDKRLADLDKIQKRIHDFQNNVYDLDTDQCTLPASQQFEERLQEVHQLCQPQNMELWQHLPDDPAKRPNIQKLFVTQPRFKDYPYRRTKKTYELIALVLIFILPLIAGIVLSIYKHKPAAIVIAIIVGIVLGGYSYGLIRLFQAIIHRPKLNSIRIANHKSPAFCYSHFELYKYGVKTIATITNISFQPCEPDDINPQSDYEHPRIEVPPTYEITYKFNPPDDDTPDDIFHTIKTHIIPESLKIGDPLPILYRTQYLSTPGKLGPHVMQSMPFPLPFSDLDSSTDYVGEIKPAIHHNSSSPKKAAQ
ncbi:MAG: protein kinase [Proteobacteria bacterium]|nr:protein kinase [Pseudomonadota bacterium]